MIFLQKVKIEKNYLHIGFDSGTRLRHVEWTSVKVTDANI